MSERFEETRRVWKQRVVQWQSSGQTMSEWCKAHQLNYKAFIYWKKRFLIDASQKSFTELKDTKACIIRIEYNGVRILLESGTFKECLTVIKELAC